MNCIVGWDVGGVNIKAACVVWNRRQVRQEHVNSVPFEIWREKNRLPAVLQDVYSAIIPDLPPRAMAVTMTAELSDVFPTKREGVLYVLECVKNCFPDIAAYVLNVSGEFVIMDKAQECPLDFAASNWRASAQWISRKFPNCLLVDIGSTTTDILPVLDGKVIVSGSTDMDRLSSGELVFTGSLRTNLAALAQSVPVAGRICRVASEYFAVSGDVHLILGHLKPREYTCSTPDGQPPSIGAARRRLARLVCADTEMLSTAEIDELARFLYKQQVLQISEGMTQVISRQPRLLNYPVIVFGVGAFLGEAAAEKLGLEVQKLSTGRGDETSAAVPCLAAAHLLSEYLKAVSE